MIERFITFKEPHIIEDKPDHKGGLLLRTHVVMSDGRHFVISDAKHGEGWGLVDETLAFPSDPEGNITDWTEVAGGRFVRTEDVINSLNEDD